MKNERSVDAFKALASRAGMCPATALLEPVAGGEPTEEGQSWRLPKQELLECVCDGASVGGQSFFECLIRAPWESGVFNVLIDTANAFDPASLDTQLAERLLWVRVTSSKQLVRAMDLLLRDDNFALVAADLRGFAAKELHAIQPFAWYRLQRLAHQRAGGCVVFSDSPSVRCADRRMRLSGSRRIGDLDSTREELLASLEGTVRYQNKGKVLSGDEEQVG
ncbi:MAG: hypothetical protein ACSHYA_07955 [Opitutaceae bacterium]